MLPRLPLFAKCYSRSADQFTGPRLTFVTSKQGCGKWQHYIQSFARLSAPVFPHEHHIGDISQKTLSLLGQEERQPFCFTLRCPCHFRPYWPTCHESRQSLDAYITYVSENKSSNLSTAQQGHVNPCLATNPGHRIVRLCAVLCIMAPEEGLRCSVTRPHPARVEIFPGVYGTHK